MPEVFFSVFMSGLIAILLIIPVSLSIGLTTSLLWAKYLSWASAKFAGKQFSIETAFQISAYSGGPLLLPGGLTLDR